MSKKSKAVKYDLGNEFFTKVSPEKLNADSKINVPDTHYAVVLKNGAVADVFYSGNYELFKSKAKSKWKDVKVEFIYLCKAATLKTQWSAPSACGEITIKIIKPRKAFSALFKEDAEISEEAFKSNLSACIGGKAEELISGGAGDTLESGLRSYAQEELGLEVVGFTAESVAPSAEVKSVEPAPVKSEAAEAAGEVAAAAAPAAKPARRECPFCGKKNTPKAKFCTGCGRKLG